MTLSAREYKPGLGKREASLTAGLAEAGKPLFTVDDAKAAMGGQTRDVVGYASAGKGEPSAIANR
jgi:hypothetical protein